MDREQIKINTQKAINEINELNEDFLNPDLPGITQNGEINIAANQVDLNICNSPQDLQLENEFLKRENAELKEQIKTLNELISLLKK